MIVKMLRGRLIGCDFVEPGETVAVAEAVGKALVAHGHAAPAAAVGGAAPDLVADAGRRPLVERAVNPKSGRRKAVAPAADPPK